MAIPQLLVHDRKDTVGVVVIEGLKKGTDMLCVVTHDNSSFKLKSKMDVPIGHKVALTDIKKGDTIWKYGQDIGVAKAKIGKGEHVHVHNVKTNAGKRRRVSDAWRSIKRKKNGKLCDKPSRRRTAIRT